MRLQFFTVPAHDAEDAAAALNRFLGEHRILSIDRQLIADGVNSFWAICVSFDQSEVKPGSAKRGKVDFKDVLSEAEFAVFARLRALRKQMAEAEGIPAYALFTNEQLADMVQKRVGSAAALRRIPGVGEARVEKYGPAFLDLLAQAGLPETVEGQPSDAA